MQAVIDRIKYIMGLYPVDGPTRRFIAHNEQIWADFRVDSPDATVLIDFFRPSQAHIPFSYFANVFARRHNACIKTFWPALVYQRPSLYRVYESFNTVGSICPDSERRLLSSVERDCNDIVDTLSSKRQLFDLVVDGVWIGIDIYESYLRLCNRPTVDFEDPRLKKTIFNGIAVLRYWQRYFSRNNVAGVISSHDSYVNPNILNKVAYRHKVPVYLPNVRTIHRADREFSIYMPLFRNYRAMFRSMSLEEQNAGIELGRRQLTARLQGKVGVDMAYSTKSAYSPDSGGPRILRESGKTKVLICSHCFYDNPHGFGGMFFTDFYEWLCFLGRISEKTDYDWYIKMHPDALPGTEETILGILAKYPRIQMIPCGTSQHKLIREGLNVVLTVYGSVGHELPLLGVQVVNGGYNPHVGYDFNWHPQSLEEYESMLLRLGSLKKTINPDDVYEFYYMHYYYTTPDDVFLPSYRSFLRELSPADQGSTAVYDYFLKGFSEERHKATIARIEAFLDSGKNDIFQKGPE